MAKCDQLACKNGGRIKCPLWVSREKDECKRWCHSEGEQNGFAGSFQARNGLFIVVMAVCQHRRLTRGSFNAVRRENGQE